MVAGGLDAEFLAFSAYVLAFGSAGIACFVSIPRASKVADQESRTGLVWLLALSGGWASAHVGYIAAPWDEARLAFYLVGLVTGFAAVGAWLYFCSAYTGRTLHRNPTFRRIALGAFLGVVAMKLTNPIHGLYFSTTHATDPFTYLAVQHATFHWIAMGLAYALASVGYFMLVERFLSVGQDTRPLIGLVSLTGLPLALDVLGRMDSALLDMTYEPLGVAVFAVGVLYLYLEQFQAVQVAGSDDKPTIFLDDEGRIREYNRPAVRLFPALSDAIGTEPAASVPILEELRSVENEIVDVRREGEQFYYRISRTPITAGDTQLGTLLGLVDVTQAEESRRELQRERDRLDQFASVVAHDLRNPLNVADGRLELALEALDDGSDAGEHLDAVEHAHDRMGVLIEDLLTLAREGRDIDEIVTLSLEKVAADCWATIDDADVTLAIADDCTIDADPDRLRQLLENLFRNAIEHGGTDVTITVGTLDDAEGFYVADDGPGIPPEDREQVFEAGHTTNEDGTGFGLAIVSEIVEAHGWSISVTDADGGGARFEIRT